MAARADVALVFPPVWYYTAVPADLSAAAGALVAAGASVACFDASAGLAFELLGHSPGFGALQQPATYADPAAHQAAMGALAAACEAASAGLRGRYSLRDLRFSGLDEASVPHARAAALDPWQNPALPSLRRLTDALCALDPPLIALALVHPSQRPQLLALAALLRAAGYAGFLAVYGTLEDVVSPEDFAADLPGAPRHLLFEDVDGALVGDPEPALLGLRAALAGARPWEAVPGLIAPAAAPGRPGPAAPVVAPRAQIRLDALPLPDFSWVKPEIYLAPAPVVDLRLGRGCPWARCAFCAIQAHHAGYRAGRAAPVAAAMAAAHAATGARFFRIRDDLLTPPQLVAVAEAVAALPFRARWSARARVEPSLTARCLAQAAAGGLEELWVGLESGSDRVRQAMDKGVPPGAVDALLQGAAAAGVRLRALCMLGFPGETEAEAWETLQFLVAEAPRLASFALTPFQLMGRSPMAADPARYGLILAEDPLPRHARLRHDRGWAPAPGTPALSPDRVAALMATARSRVAPRYGAFLGPELVHAWLAASIARSGW